MKKIVLIGSHLGYPMDKTPLGGGAMVGLELARAWSRPPLSSRAQIAVLGSGAEAPCPGYVRVLGEGNEDLVKFSELQYAAFCRKFERATTDWILSRAGEFPPRETCVVVNDISEGPALAELSRRGYAIVSLWHVDVVDYFNKLYLRQIVRPERLTRLYERARKVGAHKIVPDLLRLVFEKQRETVAHSRRMIIPSRMMASTIARCYGALLGGNGHFAEKAVIVPWGVWEDGVDAQAAAGEAEKLRAHFQIRPETRVVATVSRISPEKGLHLLLQAFQLAEKDARFAGEDTALFICGEPAFMQGAAYGRKVRKAAAALRRTRVFFPGYLGPAQKRAFLALADLFVSPSVHESYGLNVVEAMRAGRAVLASDHYGVQDLLSPAFGRMVPYPSLRQAPALLAAELKTLLADRPRLKAMGEAAARAAAGMPFARAAETVLETSLEAIG